MVCSVRKTIPLALASLLLLWAAGCQTTGAFEYMPGPDSMTTPWTKAPAATSAEPLRFAIVSDRCGGHRPGVFEDALRKLNLLQPDLVMCVGDLVEGYAEDANVANGMWDEFGGIVGQLSMPFFYVRGNHDSELAEMDRVWRRRIGPRYYAFVYRDCLFMSMNSLDGNLVDGSWDAGISSAQLQWARKVLADHRGVRWTFVFMHYPLWVFDEEAAEAKPGTAPKLTGFSKLEEAMAGREYTVFAGHFHQYAKYVRHGQDYHILATTGGESSLRGPSKGEFDQVVWISMTPNGPRLANLELSGILPNDIRTEAHVRLQQDLAQWKVEKVDKDPLRLTLAIQTTNLFTSTLSVSAAVKVPEGSAWSVEPTTAMIQIEPNQAGRCSFVARPNGPASESIPVPSCDIQCAPPGEEPVKISAFIPAAVLQEHFLPTRPTVSCARAQAPPKCDGKMADPLWKRSPDAASFTDVRLAHKPLASTEGYLAYDNDNLYVAIRCQEPNMAALKTTAKGRDSDVFSDDSVEFFIAPTADRKTYYHFAANAAGAVYDGKGDDGKWNSNLAAATAKDANHWSVEMAIPWKDLGVSSPKAGDRVSVLFARSRKQTDEVLQWPPSPRGNHQPAAFAEVILGQ